MRYEFKVDIAGTEYGMGDIKSVSLTQPLFEKPGVGNACSAELRIVLWEKSAIPTMARLEPYYREEGSEGDWLPLGTFFIDTRSAEDDCLSITAYDVMLKSEAVWTPDQSLNFPMTMEKASQVIAALMGTELDPRCVFNASYTIDYPANDYTLRDVLRYIAGAHAGNWIVTSEGKLLLVPLYGSMPPETHYLITQDGKAIVFGNVVILV